MIFYVCLLLTLVACGDDGGEQQLTLPTNLQFEAKASDAGTGTVSVTATADKVNFYTIFFGDTTPETGVKTNDGKASHTYATTGTYTIRVQAHTTSDAFVTLSKDVTVKVGTGDLVIPSKGYTTPDTYAGMTLVWHDEFEGTALNTNDWTFELGTGSNGWGNSELQYYRQENTSVKDGYLVITAKKEDFQSSKYTSSRIITQNKKSFQYGRVDIRAALPNGKGIWPALWMLGSNVSTVSWPKCGEIDIMEMVGGGNGDKTVYGTAHWDNAGAHASYGNSKQLSSGIFSDEFHVFSIVWTAQKITWYVDDVQFNVIDTTPAGLAAFQKEFFVIFNVAVGGEWPGNPDSNTLFPQRMIVDYVRIFQ
ncbi:family 16 glycosylhydrolase [Chryseolinea sp. Jin1]|uniref:Family 16 glycosylhydrolase n=2 Tax=Chryseolinea lacunae TaxID=2801331 RepID=A0ABS1KYS9_9BACT|nr:family 16 glycosylhydrolase [Chryseolinea lacunae]